MLEFQFDSVLAFFEMESHGRYVWPVYLLGLITLGGLVWYATRQHSISTNRIRRAVEREGQDESKA